MTATVGIVRAMDGPFAPRRCVREAGGYRWYEQTLAPGDYLDAGQLRRLAKVVPASAAVPTLLAPDLVAWPVMPTPGLLCDSLFAASPETDTEWVADVCTRLGEFLGDLHSCSAEDATPLPTRREHAWLSARSPMTAQVAAARSALASCGDGTLAAHSSVTDVRTDTVVHGRFSTGVIVAHDCPVILGWREAGLGDPDRDAAFFVAELVEAAAVGKGGVRLAVLASKFLDAYSARTTANLDRLLAFVADRLLEHYAQGIVAVGSVESVRPVVDSVTQSWMDLADLLLSGETL